MRINMDKVARGLGVASIGLGLAEIVAPRQIERFLGIHDSEKAGLLGVLGVREVMHGIDILAHDRPGVGMWGRVAGDVLDLVLLNTLAKQTRRPGNVAIAFGLVLGLTALDLICAKKLSAGPSARRRRSREPMPAEQTPRRERRMIPQQVHQPVEVG